MLALCDVDGGDGGEDIVYAIYREPDVDNAGVIGWPDGEVYDAAETGEVWYLSPVPCRQLDNDIPAEV